MSAEGEDTLDTRCPRREMDWHQLDLNPRVIAGVRRGEAAPDSVQKHDTFIFIPVSQSALALEVFYVESP